MSVGVDVKLSTPFDHAFEDGDEALEALDTQSFLLDRSARISVHHLATLGDLGEDVDESLKDVGGRQVAVVVDVQIDDALGIGTDARQRLHHQPVMVKRRAGILQDVEEDFAEKDLNLLLQLGLKVVEKSQEEGQR